MSVFIRSRSREFRSASDEPPPQLDDNYGSPFQKPTKKVSINGMFWSPRETTLYTPMSNEEYLRNFDPGEGALRQINEQVRILEQLMRPLSEDEKINLKSWKKIINDNGCLCKTPFPGNIRQKCQDEAEARGVAIKAVKKNFGNYIVIGHGIEQRRQVNFFDWKPKKTTILQMTKPNTVTRLQPQLLIEKIKENNLSTFADNICSPDENWVSNIHLPGEGALPLPNLKIDFKIELNNPIDRYFLGIFDVKYLKKKTEDLWKALKIIKKNIGEKKITEMYLNLSFGNPKNTTNFNEIFKGLSLPLIGGNDAEGIPWVPWNGNEEEETVLSFVLMFSLFNIKLGGQTNEGDFLTPLIKANVTYTLANDNTPRTDNFFNFDPLFSPAHEKQFRDKVSSGKKIMTMEEILTHIDAARNEGNLVTFYSCNPNLYKLRNNLPRLKTLSIFGDRTQPFKDGVAYVALHHHDGGGRKKTTKRKKRRKKTRMRKKTRRRKKGSVKRNKRTRKRRKKTAKKRSVKRKKRSVKRKRRKVKR